MLSNRSLLPLSRFKEATTRGRVKLGESTRPVLRWILCLMVLNHRLRAPLNLNLLSTLAWNEHAAVGWRSYGRKNNSPSSAIKSSFLLSFSDAKMLGPRGRNRRFPLEGLNCSASKKYNKRSRERGGVATRLNVSLANTCRFVVGVCS